MRKLLEIRTGLVHADGNEICDSADSYTMCGLDCSNQIPKDGKSFTQDEVEDDLCPAMKTTSRRITCPSCLSLAKFVLKNSKEFRSAIKIAEEGAKDGK